MSWSTSELRVRLAPLNRFKPSSKIFYWPFQGGTSFVDLLCFCSVLCLLCFVHVCLLCFVVTCWERADLLALVCGVFCEFVTFPLVSWVRCGTWLYRFLIFATLLTLTMNFWFSDNPVVLFHYQYGFIVWMKNCRSWSAGYIRNHWPPDKSAYLKIIFLISQPKRMLWVLKRTVSMRRFFWAPKTHVLIDG